MTHNGIENVTELLQPALAQLDMKFNGPLVAGLVFQSLNSCISYHTSNNKFVYPHKRVWIIDEECEYFLHNGVGNKIENWKRATSRLTAITWASNKSYSIGDIVMIGGKIYSAKKDIPINSGTKSPIENENDWQVITGEIETYVYQFTDNSDVLIRTEIRNPIFVIYTGTPKITNGKQEINSETGLPVYENEELIEAYIQKGSVSENINGDTSANNQAGIAYHIKFEQNEKPVNLTGYIIVK